MRKLLYAAVAAAPLALAPAARAQTTVSGSTTAPLATSSAGDVTVTSGGSITVSSTTPAITLDSANAVNLAGTISADNVDGATGVLLTGGHAGSLTTTGAITLTEDHAATDTLNGDSVVEAPFATGAGRYGVRLTGTSAFTGPLALGGLITVKGNASYGVSLEAPLAGALSVTGGVTLTGDGGTAVQELAGVAGPVTVGSAVSATGQGARALLLGGDVGGAVSITSAVTATGYSSTTRLSTNALQTALQNTPTDVEQAGSAVTVAANVAGGVYLSAPPTGTVMGSTADLDADGVADGAETTGSIVQYGSAPALLIGASGRGVTLGDYGMGDDAYGLLLRGTVTASGVEDGTPATAVQVGTGAGAVSLTGGLRVTGTLGATAYEADATALHLLSGATAAAIRNDGVISAAIADSAITTAPAAATSSAVLIEAGAGVGSLMNTGTISAAATGDALNAQAVVDRSGSLSSVLNEGVITAAVSPSAVGDALTGHPVTALDLSANTSGVTLVQQTSPVTSRSYGSTSGTADVASAAVTPVTPSIVGDVLLGSGRNTVELLSGTVTGALSLGSGEGTSLTLDGGASYAGALGYTGGSLALNLQNGSLRDTSTAMLRLSTLNIGSAGALTVTVDPAHGAATRFDVSGAAVIASGATVAVRLASVPTSQSSQSYVLISSPALSFAGTASTLGAATSYLFDANFNVDAAAGTVSLGLSRKTAAELGLAASEANSVDAVLQGVSRDPNLLQAVLAPTTRDAFRATYDQLLPEHGGGVFLAARAAAESVGRAVSDHSDAEDGAGAWVQEFVLGVEQDRDTAVASRSGGFGFAGGAHTASSAFGQLGVTAAFADAVVKNPDVDNDTQTSFEDFEAGLYWKASLAGLDLSARGAGGYLRGHERRTVSLAATDTTTAVALTDRGSWDGWTADGSLAASYQLNLGRFFLRPELSGEYFRLNQGGYDETGGGDAVDLAVDSRSGHAAFGTAAVTFGASLGDGIVWRPSLKVGARDVFSGDAGATTARFEAGGDAFTLAADPITGVGGLVDLGLKATGSGRYEVFVDAHGEEYAHYREGDVRAGVKFIF